MKIILAIIVQTILAYTLGFIAPYSLGIGNGLELIAIPIGMTVGVVLGGWVVTQPTTKTVMVTLIGSTIGAAILTIPNVAFGFTGILLPFTGAMIGFYIVGIGKVGSKT